MGTPGGHARRGILHRRRVRPGPGARLLSCPDVPDAVDDGLIRRPQRGAAPVRRDVTERARVAPVHHRRRGRGGSGGRMDRSSLLNSWLSEAGTLHVSRRVGYARRIAPAAPRLTPRRERSREAEAVLRAGVPRLEHWCTGGSPVTLKRPEGRATGAAEAPGADKERSRGDSGPGDVVERGVRGPPRLPSRPGSHVVLAFGRSASVSSRHAVEQPVSHAPPWSIPSATPDAPSRRADETDQEARGTKPPVVHAERHHVHHHHPRRRLAVLATTAAATANREPRGAERRNTSPRRRRQRKLEFPNYPARR